MASAKGRGLDIAAEGSQEDFFRPPGHKRKTGKVGRGLYSGATVENEPRLRFGPNTAGRRPRRWAAAAGPLQPGPPGRRGAAIERPRRCGLRPPRCGRGRRRRFSAEVVPRHCKLCSKREGMRLMCVGPEADCSHSPGAETADALACAKSSRTDKLGKPRPTPPIPDRPSARAEWTGLMRPAKSRQWHDDATQGRTFHRRQ